MLTTDTDVKKRLADMGDLVGRPGQMSAYCEFIDAIEEAFTRSRWVEAQDIVGIMELADFFAVGRSTITNWSAQRFRNGMPEPLRKLGATPIYSLREVVRWWIDWKPSKGAKAGTLPIGIDTEGV